MMKLTDRQWKTVKSIIGDKDIIIKEIETANYLDTIPKGSAIDIVLKFTGDINVKIKGEKLNEFWAITPRLEINNRTGAPERPHKTQRCLTHIQHGVKAFSFKNRKTALQAWQIWKNADVHYDRLELMDTKSTNFGDIMNEIRPLTR